jgi:negative regulator of genetic competence, sporulation and motility
MISHEQEIQWTYLITLTDFSKFSAVPHLPEYTHAIMSQEASSNLQQHLDVTFRLPEYTHTIMSQEASSNFQQHLDVTFQLPEP